MSGHVISTRIYYGVFAVLMILTATTITAAFVDLGSFSIVVALAIAVTKAVLVILFFMHVRYSTRLTWVVVIAGFFWLAMLLSLTLTDYATRGWLAAPGR